MRGQPGNRLQTPILIGCNLLRILRRLLLFRFAQLVPPNLLRSLSASLLRYDQRSLAVYTGFFCSVNTTRKIFSCCLFDRAFEASDRLLFCFCLLSEDTAVISRAIDYNTIFWPVQAGAKKDGKGSLYLGRHTMRPQRRNHEKQRLQ